MCCIVAYKTEDGWILGKNRDRSYDPSVNFYKNTKGKVTYTAFTDIDTNWCEGINSKGITMVNASLMVVDDEKALDKAKKKPTAIAHDGVIFKQCLGMKDIRKIVDHIVKSDVMGFTFVTDGESLYVIENVRERQEVQDIEGKTKIKSDTIKKSDDIEKEVIKHSTNWFKVSEEDSKIGSFLVRTNHGDVFDDTGYESSTDDGKSSRHRKEAIESCLKGNKVKSPTDLIKCMSVTPNNTPSYNPVRLKGKCKLYTTAQFVTVPHEQKMYFKPLHGPCTVNNGKPEDSQNEMIDILKESFNNFKEFINKV